MALTFTNPIIWGPMAGFDKISKPQNGYSGFTWALNDADNKISQLFSAPKSGNINRIGCIVSARVGSPPTYVGGIYTVSAGFPTAVAVSSEDVLTFGATGVFQFTLATPAAVTEGTMYAMVIRPGGSAPNGSNYISIVADGMMRSNFNWPHPTYYAAAWARFNQVYGTGLSIYYDDNTVIFPTINNVPCIQMNNGTTPDEGGAYFKVPFNAKCCGAVFQVLTNGTTAAYDFNVVLYASDGATAVRTVAIDVSSYTYATDGYQYLVRWAPYDLVKDTYYRLTIQPSGGSSINIPICPMNDTYALTYFSEGPNFYKTTRANLGAWTEDNTGLAAMGILLSEIS